MLQYVDKNKEEIAKGTCVEDLKYRIDSTVPAFSLLGFTSFLLQRTFYKAFSINFGNMRPSEQNCLTYFIFSHKCKHVTFVLQFILSLDHGDMETLCETPFAYSYSCTLGYLEC